MSTAAGRPGNGAKPQRPNPPQTAAAARPHRPPGSCLCAVPPPPSPTAGNTASARPPIGSAPSAQGVRIQLAGKKARSTPAAACGRRTTKEYTSFPPFGPRPFPSWSEEKASCGRRSGCVSAPSSMLLMSVLCRRPLRNTAWSERLRAVPDWRPASPVVDGVSIGFGKRCGLATRLLGSSAPVVISCFRCFPSSWRCECYCTCIVLGFFGRTGRPPMAELGLHVERPHGGVALLADCRPPYMYVP